jgi:uncharacterized membrane protein
MIGLQTAIVIGIAILFASALTTEVWMHVKIILADLRHVKARASYV